MPMIEIHHNLFIGDEGDYERSVRPQQGWRVVHACKEPYHRQALGYTTRAAPRSHPEYLIARRGDRLILNLVDAPDPAFIGKELIDAALAFIHLGLNDSQQILVHCNEGRSRSSMIGLLYLAAFTDLLPDTFDNAEQRFRELYPPYNPGIGVRGFLRIHFDSYRQRTQP
jgi:hypothetical protein